MESGWDPASNSSVMRVNMTQTMHCCSPNQGQMTSVHAVAQDGTEHVSAKDEKKTPIIPLPMSWITSWIPLHPVVHAAS